MKKKSFNQVARVRFEIIENNDEKVRDHWYITGKCAAHWSCNKNIQLTIKVLVIFHNLRSYNSHLIFYEVKNLMWKLMFYLKD